MIVDPDGNTILVDQHDEAQKRFGVAISLAT